MKIQFKDEEITLKRTFRSLLLFENITNSTFAPKTITDIITYLYCCVLASKPGIELGFNEFIDLLDDQPTLLEDFQKWILKTDDIQDGLAKKKTKKGKESL